MLDEINVKYLCRTFAQIALQRSHFKGIQEIQNMKKIMCKYFKTLT